MALLATSIISCQSNKKEPENNGADTATVVSGKVDTTNAAKEKMATGGNGAEILSVSPDAEVKAPQFSNEEVNAGFAKFEPLKDEYAAAINSKDKAKIKAVTAKYIIWVNEASKWGSKLTKDENQIYIDHYTKLVTQWDKLTARIKK